MRVATTPRFGGQRGGIQAEVLTEAHIADAAMTVARRTGIARLTVKAVAEALGITSPALYFHVAGRRALLDLVVSHVVETQFAGELGGLPDEDWIDALNRVLGKVTTLASNYPGVIGYLLGEATAIPASLKVSGFVVEQLRRSGLSREQTAYAYAAICALISGWSLVSPHLDPPAAGAYGELGDVFAAVAGTPPEQRLKVALNALLTGLHANLPTAAPRAQQRHYSVAISPVAKSVSKTKRMAKRRKSAPA